ncbi:hypothetical protein C4D60_Mb11t14550 [Musa balbisiana]|uniref:Uncharacterized protein n=1 Tax=Musa balbisiana TaxID=52838 RepID=A0A4S8J463_MUSBA|nr:hypothetical protein C4D60_Mb11t14550 [Musa balbisiana]
MENRARVLDSFRWSSSRLSFDSFLPIKWWSNFSSRIHPLRY